MTATTVDREAVLQAGIIRELPVAASTTIYLGSMVATNSSGYLVSLTDSAAVKFAGVAAEGVDNSAGSAADYNCQVYRSQVHEMVAAGLAVTDVGKPLYATDNQTVTTTVTTQHVGFLARYKSATEAPLDIQKAVYKNEDDNDSATIDAPVAATTAISAGDLVALDNTGYLVTGDDATGVRFAGVALEAADNSAGADGDINCRIDNKGVFNMTCSGLTQADVGKALYCTADTTVSLTKDDVYVGTLEEFSSATVAPVRIDDAVQRAGSAGTAGTGRFFVISAFQSVIGSSTVYPKADMEFPTKFRVISSFMSLVTAPGGGTDTVTCSLTDGTTTHTMVATNTDVFAENKTITATPFLANTDIDITLIDSATTGAGANITFICEEV